MPNSWIKFLKKHKGQGLSMSELEGYLDWLDRLIIGMKQRVKANESIQIHHFVVKYQCIDVDDVVVVVLR